MESLTVALGARAYPIHIGAGLSGRVDLMLPYLAQRKVAIVTNTTVAPLLLPSMTRRLRELDVDVVEVVLPDGERFKDWQTLQLIFDALIAAACERNTTLLALGGGVIGDMAGFAAAVFQRGAPFIQVPTTLLAQVDSSVGGKTAINHPLGKNMIGMFHQPKLVLIDTQTLQTLPERELRAGLAEVIKYGLIRDLPFLEWLEEHIDGLLARDPELLRHAICQSCRNKAEVVVADEHEHGERALLNLGHTFGHAIEAGLGYGQWLHGEAVAAGTMMALELSCALDWLERADVARVDALFKRAGLPTRGPALGTERYVELMARDKKVRDGRLRLVLLSRIGHGVVSDAIEPAAVRAAIAARSERD